MKLVERENIDESKWRLWFEKSRQSQPFLSLDYLDAVSKNLVFLLNDDESGGMPLPYFEKFGVQALYTPVFCRWIDWIGENPIKKEVLTEFLATQFKVVDIYFRQELLSGDSTDLIYQKVTPESFKLNQQAKRKIKSFEKTRLNITSEINIEAGVEFLRKELSNRIETLHDADFDLLGQVISKSHKNNLLHQFSFFDEDELAGTIFLIETEQSMLYLKGTCTAKWKNTGGMYALIHQGIQLAFESNRTFDFGGSRVDGVRKFNRCFGGEDQHYYGYSWNDGPIWYKALKELKNKWKKK
ncbi:hypothetical protein N9F27_01015 [Crocinitomicaceae bacterium]|jgi:hypothetical protein|nr:hypothetical protein [Crocinitomicaceae bacterium]